MDKNNINTQLLYGESRNAQRMHWQRRVKKWRPLERDANAKMEMTKIKL